MLNDRPMSWPPLENADPKNIDIRRGPTAYKPHNVDRMSRTWEIDGDRYLHRRMKTVRAYEPRHEESKDRFAASWRPYLDRG